MGSMRKQMLLQQRASFELTLQERMCYLSGKGIEPAKVGKDAVVGKLGADIKAVNERLKTVTGNDRKAAELAKTKAKSAAA